MEFAFQLPVLSLLVRRLSAPRRGSVLPPLYNPPVDVYSVRS
jgi:hypothetical protein